MPGTLSRTHRLPHRGDDRDAVPPRRGRAHRRHLGLHRAPAAGAAREAEGFRFHQREDRPHRRASTRTSCSASPTCRRTSRPSSRARGIEVHLFNHRSVAEILRMIRMLGGMIGCEARAAALAERLEAGVEATRAAAARLPRRPRVYFEEWDEPLIAGIRWVGEVIEAAGGDNCFPELAREAARPRPHHRRSGGSRAPRAGHHFRVLVRQEIPPRPRGRAAGLGRRSRPCATASCTRSSRRSSCSRGRPR